MSVKVTYVYMYMYVDIAACVCVHYKFFAACALQFLRSKGVAHMDLKPQNLLLSVSPKRKYRLKVGGNVYMYIYTCIFVRM